MKFFKLSLVFFITALFLTACTKSDVEQVYTDRSELGVGAPGFGYDNDAVWARENLDLQAVGELIPLADDASELEYLLNNQDGINNLDLNGDGYADYISVREFDDRYDDERGFSLYSMFGPDEIQEIATIIFDRNGYNEGYNYPGARVLLTGNEQIYGDDYYYESNWLDRSLPLASWLFDNRDDYYRSPYYYNYYPDYYEPYPVVDTVVYRERVREYYPEPVFVYTAQPTFVEEVKVVSPYREKTMTKVYANLAKPTRQQFEFKEKNPNVKELVRANREQAKQQFQTVAARPDKQQKELRNRFDKQQAKLENRQMREQMREKPNREERSNFQNQAKAERQQQQQFDKQQRAERQQQQRFDQQQQRAAQQQQQRVEREQQRAAQQQQRQQQQQVQRQQQQQQQIQRQQQRVERQQPQRQQPQQRVERPQPQQRPQMNNGGGGGNPNKGGGGGGGNPNKGGGGGNGGGGKKGKG
jgi:hypothetical protein